MRTAGGLQSVDRALAILTRVAEAGSLGLSAVAREVGLSKAATHRVLVTLSEHAFVEQDPLTRAYRLGPQARRLAVPAALDVRALARPVLEALAGATQLSAFLTVPRADVAVCVDRVESGALVRVSYEPGREHPYYAGAPGRALLAAMPPARRERILARLELRPLTERTIVERGALLAALARIRADGFAVSHEELALGVSGVAAAVVNGDGMPLAALSLAGPTTLVDGGRLEAHAARIRDAAQALSRRLAGDERRA